MAELENAAAARRPLGHDAMTSKLVVITGGDSGIGLSTATAVARALFAAVAALAAALAAAAAVIAFGLHFDWGRGGPRHLRGCGTGHHQGA